MDTKTASNLTKGAIVLGMGLSGRSAIRFLMHQGIEWILGIDKKADLLREDPQIQDLCQRGLLLKNEDLESIDWSLPQCVILSPGIPSTHPICAEAEKRGIEVLGEIELAARFIKQPCIGITGTNGKTTVTLLVEHVLNASGRPAQALGNVEIPLAESLIDPKIKGKILVTELSSYQLETLQTPFLDAAVILNVTPDHLDRYKTMEAYAAAKWKIQDCLKEENGRLLIGENVLNEYPCGSKRKRLTLYGYSSASDFCIKEDSLLYRGKPVFSLLDEWRNKKTHDVENAIAAFGLCEKFGVTSEEFLSAYKTFKKPSHRVEFVREVDGVRFYDDSKGTNIDAVVRAVQMLSAPLVLIAGGVDKGASYLPWIEGFNGKVEGICAIGAAASKIYEELSSHLPVKIYATLDDAVRGAFRWAKKGGTVLLSPGCSSFDMFRDYKHRGEEFQRLVKRISL